MKMKVEMKKSLALSSIPLTIFAIPLWAVSGRPALYRTDQAAVDSRYDTYGTLLCGREPAAFEDSGKDLRASQWCRHGRMRNQATLESSTQYLLANSANRRRVFSTTIMCNPDKCGAALRRVVAIPIDP